MSRKIVSCIILNYNDAPTTINLVERISFFSLLDFVVVVDNCSTDDSWTLLQSCASDKVRVVKSPRNGGYVQVTMLVCVILWMSWRLIIQLLQILMCFLAKIVFKNFSRPSKMILP